MNRDPITIYLPFTNRQVLFSTWKITCSHRDKYYDTERTIIFRIKRHLWEVRLSYCNFFGVR